MLVVLTTHAFGLICMIDNTCFFMDGMISYMGCCVVFFSYVIGLMANFSKCYISYSLTSRMLFLGALLGPVWMLFNMGE